MRSFYFDKYNTWHDWRLTLTAKDVTPPEPKTNYVALDGMHGTLDLTEALTGEVSYNDRTVTASFWTSEGTHQDRVRLMNHIAASLHGKKVKIIEPDDPEHYFLGRVTVKPESHDMVHDEFTMTAICEPWRYALYETERKVELNGVVDVVIHNHGVKTLCPILTVTGTVNITANGFTHKLGAGTYRVSDLKLEQGINVFTVSGYGSVTFVYREASL